MACVHLLDRDTDGANADGKFRTLRSSISPFIIHFQWSFNVIRIVHKSTIKLGNNNNNGQKRSQLTVLLLVFSSGFFFLGCCDNNSRYGKSIPSGTFWTVSNRTVFSMHGSVSACLCWAQMTTKIAAPPRFGPANQLCITAGCQWWESQEFQSSRFARAVKRYALNERRQRRRWYYVVVFDGWKKSTVCKWYLCKS